MPHYTTSKVSLGGKDGVNVIKDEMMSDFNHLVQRFLDIEKGLAEQEPAIEIIQILLSLKWPRHFSGDKKKQRMDDARSIIGDAHASLCQVAQVEGKTSRKSATQTNGDKQRGRMSPEHNSHPNPSASGHQRLRDTSTEEVAAIPPWAQNKSDYGCIDEGDVSAPRPSKIVSFRDGIYFGGDDKFDANIVRPPSDSNIVIFVSPPLNSNTSPSANMPRDRTRKMTAIPPWTRNTPMRPLFVDPPSNRNLAPVVSASGLHLSVVQPSSNTVSSAPVANLNDPNVPTGNALADTNSNSEDFDDIYC